MGQHMIILGRHFGTCRLGYVYPIALPIPCAISIPFELSIPCVLFDPCVLPIPRALSIPCALTPHESTHRNNKQRYQLQHPTIFTENSIITKLVLQRNRSGYITCHMISISMSLSIIYTYIYNSHI